MGYDFDTLADRRNAANMKYMDAPATVLQAGGISFCGAEMDFKTAPEIIRALVDKAENGLYGFTVVDDEYLDATANWMKERRNFEIEKEWVLPTYGTLQSIAAAIRAFSDEGDGVVIQPPVYMLYNRVITLNKRVIVENKLHYDQGQYQMDFARLEQCFSLESTKIMILCNPHNPIGKVWDRETLTTLAILARKYGVLVISDEIFAEIVFENHYTVPYVTIEEAREHAMVTTSLGKTFNFTGFSHANVIIPSEEIRLRLKRQKEIDHYGSMNPFVRQAVVAAYTQGHRWLEEMIAYVYVNVRLLCAFFNKYMPQVTVSEPQGTFLVWIDWNGLGMDEDALNVFLVQEAALDLDRGSRFGAGGTGFSRMNLATPRAQLESSLARLLAAAERMGYTSTINEVN